MQLPIAFDALCAHGQQLFGFGDSSVCVSFSITSIIVNMGSDPFLATLIDINIAKHRSKIS